MWNLEQELIELEQRSLRRRLREVGTAQGPHVQVGGQPLVNFSSNDYLGLASSEELRVAIHEGVELYGAGSGASRLVCGTMAPHVRLEAAIAAFKGTEAALSFSSGYAVAVGTLPALMREGDVIILDKLCHASLVDAARLSGATIRVFPHNHLGKLEKLLQSSAGKRTLVVTESIFSMDGDAAALAEIVELKEKHGAWLMVDEAHAVGVLGPQGRGLAAALGLDQRVDLHMGTLSKALGLSGGYLAASRTVIDLMINRARSFIYSTAPPPCLAHAACAALELVRGSEGDELRRRLQTNIALWHSLRGDSASDAGSAIVPLIVGDEEAAMKLSAQLLEEGMLIPAIRYPTVARGMARLRITMTAVHEAQDIERLAALVRDVRMSAGTTMEG